MPPAKLFFSLKSFFYRRFVSLCTHSNALFFCVLQIVQMEIAHAFRKAKHKLNVLIVINGFDYGNVVASLMD